MINFKPAHNRVLIAADPVETQTSSGLFIPAAPASSVNSGTVLATGPGRETASGTLVPIDLALGSQVMYPATAAIPVRLEGVSYVVVDANDIFACKEL